MPNLGKNYNLGNVGDPRIQRVLQDIVDRQNYIIGEMDRMKEESAQRLAMTAGKASPQPGIINLPALGAPAFIRVRPDGVIHSFVGPTNISSNGQIIGVPYTILSRFDQVPTVGAGVTNLHQLTLPANSLAADGDFLEVIQNGTYANNTNTKRLAFGFGLSTIEDTGLIDVRGGLAWQTYYLAVRTSPVVTTVIFSGWFQFIQADSTPALTVGGFGGRFISRGSAAVGTNNLNTSTNPINVSGQATSNGDIVQTFTAVNLTRMS